MEPVQGQQELLVMKTQVSLNLGTWTIQTKCFTNGHRDWQTISVFYYKYPETI